jgi:hypothetical protein
VKVKKAFTPYTAINKYNPDYTSIWLIRVFVSYLITLLLWIPAASAVLRVTYATTTDHPACDLPDSSFIDFFLIYTARQLRTNQHVPYEFLQHGNIGYILVASLAVHTHVIADCSVVIRRSACRLPFGHRRK